MEPSIGIQVPSTPVPVANTQVVDPERIVNLMVRAIDVLGSTEKARAWLASAVPVLGGKTPLSLMRSAEGIEQVTNVLGRIEHGVW